MCNKDQTLTALKARSDINGDEIERIIIRQGGAVRLGKGDDDMCLDKQGHPITPCPHRRMGYGLARKIIKLLLAAGFVSFTYGIIFHMGLLH